MPVLPFPLIVSLVLGYLLLRALLRGGTHPLLLTLLAACAVQGIVTSLVQYYGLAALRPLQPVTASVLPALTWLAFVASAQRSLMWRRDAAHAAGPVAAALCAAVAPGLFDVLIPGLFAGYGVAVLVAVSHSEGLPRAPLESGQIPQRLWQVVAVMLLASALSDGLIEASILSGRPDWRPVIIGMSSSIFLLVIGRVSLSREFGGGNQASKDDGPQSASGDDESALVIVDTALLARLDQLMAERQPYLDPDLTLAKLARKLTVPAKSLSATINRGRAENVSRYVNRLRVEHACTLLEKGTPITAAALESGFNTKSNFNREFSRVMESTPSAWLANRRDQE